jgi:DNA polymerase-3 subunit gamma/tau
MSYIVSARRWRPQSFADLVGQEHVSRTLTNAIRAGRVAHAFLFTGVRGVGKTTAARILAKALNCAEGPTPTPCNTCVNCREITAGSAVDVLEIDGASNTGVDDVREIIENVRYQAAKSRFKVYIIDEVHMLSNSAFNALLKTLEEPPPHVKFIFATTDPHKLPATVLSRCQRYDFRRIPLRLVVERLRQIAAEEGVALSDRALFMIAREGEGSMRDAQSLLDQVLAGGAERVADEDVLAVLGVADRALVSDMVDAMLAREPARVLERLEEVYHLGYDLRRLARDLLEQVRDLAVAKATRNALLPDLPEEERTRLIGQAEQVSGEDCDRVFQMLRAADEEIGRSPYPKMVIEMTLIKAATLPAVVPLAALIERLETLEGRLRAPAAGSAPGGSAAKAGSSPRPATSRAAAEPTEGPVDRSAVGGAGDARTFVAWVGRERSTLGHHLGRCALVPQDNNVLEVRAPRGFCYNYLARRDHLEELESLAARHFGRAVRVHVVAAEGASETANEDAGPSAEERRRREARRAETALADPVVQAAVEILGGEVAEVRSRTRARREER